MLVEGPVDALAARWLHPGAVVWCCGGALRLDPGELTRSGAACTRVSVTCKQNTGNLSKTLLLTSRHVNM